MPFIAGGPRIVWNIRRLLDAAKILGLPAAATEQYPKGLGPTVPELAERLGPCPRSSLSAPAAVRKSSPGLRSRGIHKVLVCGDRGPRLHPADGVGPAGRRLAGFRGRRRRRLAVRRGLSDRFAADGFGRGDADDHRGGDLRVVRDGRRGRVQADQPAGAGRRGRSRVRIPAAGTRGSRCRAG